MCKIRMDYVTNSSSSSFVIAKRNDLTLDDCKELLSTETAKEDLIRLFKWDFDSYDLGKKISHLFEDEKSDEALELLIPKLADRLFEFNTSMDLGDWSVGVTEASNESDNAFSYFLYGAGDLLDNCEKIKTTMDY